MDEQQHQSVAFSEEKHTGAGSFNKFKKLWQKCTEKILGILKSFEVKDRLTISVSMAAVFISLWSLFQSTEVAEREARIQLTSVNERLISLPIEIQKFMLENKIDHNDPKIFGLLIAINHQNEILTRQALALINENKENVTYVDFITVASALSSIGDLENSHKQWLEAINHADSQTSKLICKRGYAEFLSSFLAFLGNIMTLEKYGGM